MLAVTLRIKFFGSNLQLVEVALCAFLPLNKSFLNSLVFYCAFTRELIISTLYFLFNLLIHFVEIPDRPAVSSFPFLQPAAFLVEYYDRKVPFSALKDAYFSLGSICFRGEKIDSQ